MENEQGEMDNTLGYTVFILTVVSLFGINILVARYGMPKNARPEQDPWIWNNIVISWIHGLVCGIWSIACVYYYPEFMEDPVTFNRPLLYFMVAFSSGYFLYDTLDMILNNKLLKHWEVTLHHIFVVPGFWYNWHAQVCIGFSLVALLAEVNSFFLHSRKLLQISQVGFHTPLYRLCSISNLITFVFCRIMPISFILWSTYLEIVYRFPRRLSMFYMCSIAIIMIIVAVINVILFYRLFKSDVLRPYFKSKKQYDIVVNGNNNSKIKRE